MFIAIFLLASCILATEAHFKLTKYNIDPSQITVSGISAGGAMATQLHVAFSRTISGSASIAGPPYYCAQGLLSTATSTCMNPLLTAPSATTLVGRANNYANQNLIDPTSNLRNHRTYFYSGTMDFTVRPAVVKVGEQFYSSYMSASNIKTVYSYASAHGHITDNFGTACGTTNSQHYINNCNYNQAYDLLSWLHNTTLQKPKTVTEKTNNGKRCTESNSTDPSVPGGPGELISFDQTEFFPAGTASTILLDKIGYMYIPAACKAQQRCRLHLALHGCLQGAYKIGKVYVEKAGYNEVADLNNFIILYPQAINSLMSNPNGCFDWWGFTSSNYATNQGVQMRAIKAMIDRLAN
jgi:hypothetical protein